jgi:glycosyltransferase involved in cell wall biosynthesis
MREGVAIVVPVRNEADNLSDLLDDLSRQVPAPREVIVVDAGSTDGTRQLLEQRATRWPALQLCLLDEALPGRARNEGVIRSRCDLIATLDAGSRVGPGWLDSLSAPLREGTRRVVCVGQAVADPRSEFERAAGWLTLRAFKPVGRRPLLAPDYRPAGRNGLCFSRSAWQYVSGYPETIRWGEDKAFVERLRAAGIELLSVPDAVVRWRPRRSLRELFRQYDGYGRGDAIARVDRQNELVTLGLYGVGTALAIVALAGSAGAAIALGAAIVAYLSLFTLPAIRELGPRPALAWVPLVRITADLAKVRGFLVASVAGLLRSR